MKTIPNPISKNCKGKLHRHIHTAHNSRYVNQEFFLKILGFGIANLLSSRSTYLHIYLVSLVWVLDCLKFQLWGRRNAYLLLSKLNWLILKLEIINPWTIDWFKNFGLILYKKIYTKYILKNLRLFLSSYLQYIPRSFNMSNDIPNIH